MKGLGMICIASDLLVVAEIARRFGMEAPVPLGWKLLLAAPMIVFWLSILLSSGGEQQ